MSIQNKLINRLNPIFSEYIRKRDKGVCITCFRKQDWDLTDAGHYIDRANHGTLFDEINVNCQCRYCNRSREKKSMLETYRKNLIMKHGIPAIEALEAKGKEIGKLYNSELRERIEYYKEKIKNIV